MAPQIDGSQDPDGLWRSLGRIEAKQDLILTQMSNLAQDHKDLDQRVHAVEKRQYWLAGVLSVIAIFGKELLTKLTNLIGT